MESSLSRSGFAGPLTSVFTPPPGCKNFALIPYVFDTSQVSTGTTTMSDASRGTFTSLISTSYSSAGTMLSAIPYFGRCDKPRWDNTCLPSGNRGVFSPAFDCPDGFSPVLTVQPVTGVQNAHVYLDSTNTLTYTEVLVTNVPTSTMFPGETAILCCPRSVHIPSLREQTRGGFVGLILVT